MLEAGTESAAVSLTLTAATENNTASRPSAGRDRPGVPVLSDTVDPALAAAKDRVRRLPDPVQGRELAARRLRPNPLRQRRASADHAGLVGHT